MHFVQFSIGAWNVEGGRTAAVMQLVPPCGLLPRSLDLDPLVKDGQQREGVSMLGLQEAPPLPAAPSALSYFRRDPFEMKF